MKLPTLNIVTLELWVSASAWSKLEFVWLNFLFYRWRNATFSLHFQWRFVFFVFFFHKWRQKKKRHFLFCLLLMPLPLGGKKCSLSAPLSLGIDIWQHTHLLIRPILLVSLNRLPSPYLWILQWLPMTTTLWVPFFVMLDKDNNGDTSASPVLWWPT